MRRVPVPEKYKKEVNDLMWKFIWDIKPPQIERNVCCLTINEEGMEMINIDNLVKSKQIKLIYKITNSEMDSWNAIGKHWLQKYDNNFGVDFFLCKCFKMFRYCIYSKILSRFYASMEQFFGVMFYGVYK